MSRNALGVFVGWKAPMRVAWLWILVWSGAIQAAAGPSFMSHDIQLQNAQYGIPQPLLRLSRLRGGGTPLRDPPPYHLGGPPQIVAYNDCPEKPPPPSAPRPRTTPEHNVSIPVLFDNVPYRQSVRERDEWLELIRSMKHFDPLLDIQMVRKTLEMNGCNCIDKNTLKFAAFLAEAYLYKIVDRTTDWAGIRLEGDEEDLAEADPKYRRRSVEEIMASLNFTLEKDDLLHVCLLRFAGVLSLARSALGFRVCALLACFLSRSRAELRVMVALSI
eukprot:2562136-Rhodomonas_salina.1